MKKKILWQLPIELHEKLVSEAENNKRSVTQEAVWILENYFKTKTKQDETKNERTD